MSLVAGFRRFYLYAAVSVALIGVAAALVALLALGLHELNLGPRPGPDEVRGTVSFAVAILIFAVPIGGAHLWLVARSLREPMEAAADVRHFFLNGWITAALLVALAAAVTLANALILEQGRLSPQPDTGTPLALLAVALAIALVAWRWRAATPPASRAWETVFAFILLTVAMVVAASSVATAARIGGEMLTPKDPLPPLGRGFGPTEAELFLGALAAAALSLMFWSVGVIWEWRRREERLRATYLVAAYAIGFVLIAVALVQELAGLERYARGVANLSRVTEPWPPLAAGALLVALHLAGLVLDRGRNGHPAVVSDRWIRGVPAIVGLGVLLAGLVSWWTYLVDHVLMTAFERDDPGDHAAFAAAASLVGVMLYAATWPLFLASTRDAPASAVRRLYVFTVICLALVATVVTGAVTAFNVLSIALGAPDRADLSHTAATWAFPAVLAAAVFATHLLLLLRDNRAARATTSAPGAARSDALRLLLEDVARGRVGVDEAAARIRSAPAERPLP